MPWLSQMWEWLGANAAAVVAIAVSLCTAGFTLYQARIARTHYPLSTRPYLSMVVSETVKHLDLDMSGRVQFGYEEKLLNAGLGPAMITGMKVLRHGQEVTLEASAVKAVVRTTINHSTDVLRVFHSTGRQGVLTGDSVQLVLLGFIAQSEREAREIIARYRALRIVLEYESLYGEQFVFDSDAAR